MLILEYFSQNYRKGVSSVERAQKEQAPRSMALTPHDVAWWWSSPCGGQSLDQPACPSVPLGCGEGLWRPIQLTQPGCPATVPPASLPGLTAGFRVFFFQIFLSYTQAGSSFVFGEALVKDIFAFQVS